MAIKSVHHSLFSCSVFILCHANSVWEQEHKCIQIEHTNNAPNTDVTRSAKLFPFTLYTHTHTQTDTFSIPQIIRHMSLFTHSQRIQACYKNRAKLLILILIWNSSSFAVYSFRLFGWNVWMRRRVRKKKSMMAIDSSSFLEYYANIWRIIIEMWINVHQIEWEMEKSWT